MGTMKKYNAVKSISNIYRLANWLSIAPSFDFMKNECCDDYVNKCYNIVWCLLILGFSVYSLVGRVLYTYQMMTAPLIFMDVLTLTINTTTGLHLMVKLTLLKREQFQRFIEALIDFDGKCSSELLQKPKCEIYIKVIAYHIVLLLFCASDSYMWNNRHGFQVLRNYLTRYVLYYQFITFSFMVYTYVRLINDRLVYLNDLLVNSVTLSNQMHIPRSLADEIKEETSVKKIDTLYMLLCDSVDLFNEVFGSSILLMLIVITLGLLQPINIAVSYSKNDLSSHRQSMDPDLIVVCIFWAVLFVMCAMMIVLPCEKAMKEGRRTSYLSYSLENKLLFPNKQINMKEDLLLLGLKSFQHSPNFSANGFFAIGHSLLGSILTSVTSYLIVLIQLT